MEIIVAGVMLLLGLAAWIVCWPSSAVEEKADAISQRPIVTDAPILTEAERPARYVEPTLVQKQPPHAELFEVPAALGELQCEIVEHATFALAATKIYSANALRCDLTSKIVIKANAHRPAQLDVRAEGIGPIGRISARHRVAEELLKGKVILYASINSYNFDVEAVPVLRLRVVTGPEGSAWAPPAPLPPKSYSANIVGEQFYCWAISKCRAGERVKLFHEPDNPYDKDAIAVVSEYGDKLGHLPRDSWLHRVLLDEARGCTAQIERFKFKADGAKEVVLAISLGGEGLEQRRYSPQ